MMNNLSDMYLNEVSSKIHVVGGLAGKELSAHYKGWILRTH
ncbi:Uncharacterised protein [Chryseobacterium carnipullorum]|jgi:hypothetical protein|uniref:Uncharacterized protein n=1 Tax=Chryseobacterium carnipullorum TaxID=1124835 RepID=A0A376DS43_CHRCU|nr:Uncharacterised protein [Chryseobacterium carnipullorum]